MLKIVNGELMSFSVTERKDPRNNRNYTKLHIVSSNKLVQYESTLKRNNANERPKKASKNTPIVSRVDNLIPVNRDIMTVSAPIEMLTDLCSEECTIKEVDLNCAMSINVQQRNQPFVEIRCHENGDDRANIYVVAFPFNGMIKPIPENPQYRIYKGLIATSARPFFFANHKYRKILYLVIEINKNLFNPDHKYHTDAINIDLESYALYTDRNTNEQKTNIEKFHLQITSAMGDYTTEWEYDCVNEAIMMNAQPGEQLWVTYTFNHPENSVYNGDKRPYRKNNYRKKNPHPMHIEGDTIVTTNRHGIRKEIPTKSYRNNYHNNNRAPQKNNNDLDYMMQKSGMYEDSGNHRGKKNGGKKNRKNWR